MLNICIIIPTAIPFWSLETSTRFDLSFLHRILLNHYDQSCNQHYLTSVQNLSRRFPNKSLHADDTAQSKTNCERDSIELRTGLRVKPIVDVE